MRNQLRLLVSVTSVSFLAACGSDKPVRPAANVVPAKVAVPSPAPTKVSEPSGASVPHTAAAPGSAAQQAKPMTAEQIKVLSGHLAQMAVGAMPVVAQGASAALSAQSGAGPEPTPLTPEQKLALTKGLAELATRWLPFGSATTAQKVTKAPAPKAIIPHELPLGIPGPDGTVPPAAAPAVLAPQLEALVKSASQVIADGIVAAQSEPAPIDLSPLKRRVANARARIESDVRSLISKLVTAKPEVAPAPRQVGPFAP